MVIRLLLLMLLLLTVSFLLKRNRTEQKTFSSQLTTHFHKRSADARLYKSIILKNREIPVCAPFVNMQTGVSYEIAVG